LHFRWWTSDDAPLARGLWGDAEVTKLIGGFDWRERLEAELELQRTHEVQYWPIFDGAEHVGCCGLRPKEPGVLELGFHLRREHWGKGYADEASRSVIAHAFEALQASRLFAGHHPENAASKRTLERLGFRYERDEPYPATGRMHPSYFLSRPPHPVPLPYEGRGGNTSAC
jgi:RimJ/RimL family protein N-acetyltransferase